MKTFIKKGDSMEVVMPYAVLSGKGVKVGLLFGVAAKDYALGETGQIVNDSAVFTLDKVSANTFTQGAAVYWNDTTKQATSVTTGNLHIGHAMDAAGNGATTMAVKLNGNAAAALSA